MHKVCSLVILSPERLTRGESRTSVGGVVGIHMERVQSPPWSSRDAGLAGGDRSVGGVVPPRWRGGKVVSDSEPYLGNELAVGSFGAAHGKHRAEPADFQAGAGPQGWLVRVGRRRP